MTSGNHSSSSSGTNRKMNLLHSRLRQTSIDTIGGRTRHQHMRPGMELRLNRHMIATDQTTGWIHEPGVGTPAVVEIRRRKVMPGTRARRRVEYRAWARSLELIGQRPTPANCLELVNEATWKVLSEGPLTGSRESSVLYNTPLEPYTAWHQNSWMDVQNRPDFSPAQPWRLPRARPESAKTASSPRGAPDPCKAAANYHLIKGWSGVIPTARRPTRVF